MRAPTAVGAVGGAARKDMAGHSAAWPLGSAEACAGDASDGFG